MVLVGTEVFAAAIAAGWALAGLLDLGDRVGHVLMGLFSLVAAWIMSAEPYQDNPTRYEYRLTDRGKDLFDVLMTLVRETGMAALIATHNLDLAGRMDRVVRLDRTVPAGA